MDHLSQWRLILVVCSGLLIGIASPSNLEYIPDLVHEVDGDLNIGVYSRVHRIDPVYLCSDKLFAYSLYEQGPAAIYAIDDINSREDILHNVTLGYVIIDDCASDFVNAARSLQFVPVMKDGRDMSFGKYFDVIGTIGPITSGKSEFTGGLFSAFRIPTIAHSSTAEELADNERFPYHFRLVPSAYYEAEAIVLLFQRMGWNFFSVVHYEDSYGYSGVKNLNYWAQVHGLCIATTVGFKDTNDPIPVVKKLQDAKAKVVVAVIYGLSLNILGAALEELDLVGNFIFTFTDCFFDLSLAGLRQIYINSVWVHVHDTTGEDLSEYLGNLTPTQLPEDPWIEDILQCFEPRETANQSCVVHLPQSVYSTFAVSYRIVDAVYVYAAAIDMIIDDHCPEGRVYKSILKTCVTGPRLAEYLYQVKVDRPSGTIEFNENREQLRTMDWAQFHADPSLPFLRAVQFGKWHTANSTLTIDESQMVWDGVLISEEERNLTTPDSVCSYPCDVGEIYLLGEQQCCWVCYRCRDNQIAAMNLTKCVDCPLLTWPDEETGYTSCRDIEPTYLTWKNPYGITLTILAASGMLGTVIIFSILIHHRDRRVVRGSGLDMILIILVGCLLGYAGIFMFVFEPGLVICTLARVCFNLSLAITFSPLLIKMHRIYSIFHKSQKMLRQMKCISPESMQMLTWMCVAFQVGVTVVICVIWQPRSEPQMPVPTDEYVEMACFNTAASMLIPLTYNLIILLSCGILGFLTRQVPENFNESWYILITVIVTFIIWIAFLSTYFSAFYLFYQAALQAFSLALNVSVVILIIFCPKLYAIYNIPDDMIKISTFKFET